MPAPAVVPTAPVPDIGPSPQITTGKRLSQLLDAHVERMQPKSRREQELSVRLFCSFVDESDPFIETVTPEKADQFYDMLKWMPNSMDAELRRRPIMDVVADMRSGKLKRPRVSGATAVKKLSLLNAMFAYAVARGWKQPPNPFARVIGPKDNKAQTKRLSLRPEHLVSTFSAPVFQGCRDYEDWRQPGNALLANHQFWLPLLAMVTGCRLEELGQLLLADIHQSDGIAYINITEQIENPEAKLDHKSVKTLKSTRRMPLHKIIIDIGFQEYCDWLRNVGETKIFPELPRGKKKTKRFSQWYNRDFRPTVGMDGRERPFHSFRHSFKDRCREADLPRDLHDALTGMWMPQSAQDTARGIRLRG